MADTGNENTAVDRQQAIPLYHQIFLQLREEITSGERAFGSRLPTEQQLSGQFGVSRITARRAMDELAAHGLVERKRRVGTTVSFKSPAKPFQGDIDQAIESLLNFGRSTMVRLVELEQVEARPPIDEAMKVEPGTPLIRVMRVRTFEDIPVGHFVTYTPLDVAEHMTAESLKTTPMLSLIEKAGVRIGAAHQTISATLADAALSSVLQVEIGSPILRVSRTVEDKAGRPVQHILAQFRPDKYQIRIDLQSPAIGAQLL